MKKKIKVKLVRSVIGCTKRQKETVRSLGLRRIHQEVDVNASPQNLGKIFKVQHLVEIK